MSRDPELRLEDILESIQSIEVYIEGYNYDSFTADRKTVDATTRCLEIIGEAVKHIPDELTSRHPSIPWRAISGFRDILAHSYFRAEDSIIWDASQKGVKDLKKVVIQLLKEI